jgi:GxxExxY protein
MTENEISKIIIGCAIRVHKALGPGLLESAYEACLYYELVKAGLEVERQKPLPIIYDEVELDCGYRMDLVVEKKVIVDTKSVAEYHNIFLAQMITYLNFSKCKLGLIINFNVILLKDGVRRVVNNL